MSPHDPATVYVAFRKDRVGRPRAARVQSADYGATWTRIVNGLREGEPVRVVREDPVRRDLLYAGTETGVYLSYDGGAQWMPFPARSRSCRSPTSRCMHGDLIAATEGRAFWILDDLSALRQHADSTDDGRVHLYAPRPAVLAGGRSVPARNAGRNPSPGATSSIGSAPRPTATVAVTFEFLDARGTVLRTYSSQGLAWCSATPAEGGTERRELGSAPDGARPD